jgi:hypothetical protein
VLTNDFLLILILVFRQNNWATARGDCGTEAVVATTDGAIEFRAGQNKEFLQDSGQPSRPGTGIADNED